MFKQYSFFLQLMHNTLTNLNGEDDDDNPFKNTRIKSSDKKILGWVTHFENWLTKY